MTSAGECKVRFQSVRTGGLKKVGLRFWVQMQSGRRKFENMEAYTIREGLLPWCGYTQPYGCQSKGFWGRGRNGGGRSKLYVDSLRTCRELWDVLHFGASI